MKKDYAKTAHMNAWLRHPVLGDPSFDTFERLGETVHRGEPPYEWPVNGSLFRDHDGTWYYYAGLYGYGYLGEATPRFKIYRSKDKGESWQDLGWGMDTGFAFEGDTVNSDGCPDVFVVWDEKRKKYLLTYDTATNDWTWEKAHSPEGHTVDSGVALAWADSPAGPFERAPHMILSNRKLYGTLGRWGRAYASCVVPRKNDYIAFCLVDSAQHFAWGLSVLTAPSPEGPWSDPHIVLGCERPGYYPCPLEFFPVELHGDKVAARATSVAMNRNYQAVFEAPLEQAHVAAAWQQTADGNVWHAHDHPDECVGIWGQTLHGFVEPDTGDYVVMHASRSTQDRGTLGLARRPWTVPHSDGFAFTAHCGASLSVLKAAYDAFALEAEFTASGTVDLAFGYRGTLGPNDSCSDSVPADEALGNYMAVRICGSRCSVVSVYPDPDTPVMPDERNAAGLRADTVRSVPPRTRTVTHAERTLPENICSIRLVRGADGCVSVWANGVPVCEELPLPAGAAPLALAAAPHSRLDCTRFAVTGEALHYTWQWNAADAILGAGQLMPEQGSVSPADELAPDRWHRMAGGYLGEGRIAAKWNVHGADFTVRFQKAPGFGRAGIWADGCFFGSISLDGEGEALVPVTGLANGPHAIRVEPLFGRIGILGCTVSGPAAD